MMRTWRCGNSGPGNECAAQAAAPDGRERRERGLVQEDKVDQSVPFSLPRKMYKYNCDILFY